MKPVPKTVILACALGVACIAIGGALGHVARELLFAGQVIAWLGVAAVIVETFRWGAREGYVIRGQSLGLRVEHTLRCAAMSAILLVISGLLSAVILQLIFELILRK